MSNFDDNLLASENNVTTLVMVTHGYAIILFLFGRRRFILPFQGARFIHNFALQFFLVAILAFKFLLFRSCSLFYVLNFCFVSTNSLEKTASAK